MKGILIDLGGVLIDNDWRAAARSWGARLRVPEPSFLAALFEGSDDQVLIGRVGEQVWWQRLRDRLQIEVDVLDELRADPAARERWDGEIVALLRRIRRTARTAIVSNAWPGIRRPDRGGRGRHRRACGRRRGARYARVHALRSGIDRRGHCKLCRHRGRGASAIERGRSMMATRRYAAFLRGVTPMNARMPELKKCFEAIGFSDVKTVLSSGNVVFSAPVASEAALQRKAEDAMEKHLGRRFLTIVRSLDALRAIVDADPYGGFTLAPAAKRIVTFLRAPPASKPQLPVERDGARMLCMTGCDAFGAYVPSPRGPVFMTLILKQFGEDVTTRTWDTVKKVLGPHPAADSSLRSVRPGPASQVPRPLRVRHVASRHGPNSGPKPHIPRARTGRGGRAGNRP